MKPSLIVVSLVALVAVALEVHALQDGRISRWCAAFIAAQVMLTVFALGSYFRYGWSSLVYFRLFYSALAVVALCALGLTLQFLRSFPSFISAALFFYAAGSFVASAAGMFLLSLKRSNMLTIFSSAHVIAASVLLLCGLCALVSLAFPLTVAEDIIRLCLGLFWVSVGAYGMSECGFYLRARADIVTRLGMTPTVLAIILFGLLAVSLHSQNESARQATRETQQLDAYIAASVSLRKGR